jgi:hypothetical protein
MNFPTFHEILPSGSKVIKLATPKMAKHRKKQQEQTRSRNQGLCKDQYNFLEDNIKMDPEEIRFQNVNWIHFV